jgi:hypothetical protein
MGILSRCESVKGRTGSPRMGPSQAATAGAKASGNFARIASAGVTATPLTLVLLGSRPSQQSVFRGQCFGKW